MTLMLANQIVINRKKYNKIMIEILFKNKLKDV